VRPCRNSGSYFHSNSLLSLDGEVKFHPTAVRVIIGNARPPRGERRAVLLGMEPDVLVGADPRASEFGRDAEHPDVCDHDQDQYDRTAADSVGVVPGVHAQGRRGRRLRAGDERAADGMEGPGRRRDHQRDRAVRRDDSRGGDGETGHGR